MKLIDRNELRERIARSKMRGNVSAKLGDIFTEKDYKTLDRKSLHTPALDKLFAIEPRKAL